MDDFHCRLIVEHSCNRNRRRNSPKFPGKYHRVLLLKIQSNTKTKWRERERPRMVEKRFDRRRSFLENANRSSFFQQEERKDRGAGDSGRKVERDAAGYRDGMTINDVGRRRRIETIGWKLRRAIVAPADGPLGSGRCHSLTLGYQFTSVLRR